MNIKTIATIGAILVILGAGIAMARPNAENNFWNSLMGGLNNGMNGMMGSGMMGSGNGNGGMMGSGMMDAGNGNGGMIGSGMMGSGNGNEGMMGSGMMGAGNGNGGMMGSGMMGSGNGNEGMMGSGMMGAGNGNGGMMGSDMMDSDMMGKGGTCGGSGTTAVPDDATPITIDQAEASINTYLENTGNIDLVIAEIIEFDNHFYAGIKEISTGKYAFELLVNRYTGSVFPEMGPNMMWNTKYGHMNGNTQGTATVKEEQAIEIAQKYLDSAVQQGTEVRSADTFYGYYTLEIRKDGEVHGMLSVNANTGAVWYHTWHGTFVGILEGE